MNTPQFVVHLLSGGLDSTVLLYDLVTQGCKVHCLLFDYKQQHVQELTFAKAHCHRLNLLFTTIELPMLTGSSLTDGKGSVVVPFRNPILLSLAVNLAASIGADSVTIGCNADDAEMFPDCRWAALDAMNHAIRLSGLKVEICAPYVNQRKWWIVRLGGDLKVPMNETWSCYKGGAIPCGHCLACQKREEAFNHTQE